MPGASETPRLVVEVERRGKLLSGEPYFTPGVPLVLETKGAGALRRGDLALVQPGRGRARVVRRLGSAARIEDVLEALLAEQGARVEFESYELPAGGGDGRVDLRELTAVTIDPEGARDFDDALSFRREKGGIRAYVHIADVSFFVRPGHRSISALPNAPSRPTCPVWSRRCCRPSSPTTPARCGRFRTGSASRSSCRRSASRASTAR